MKTFKATITKYVTVDYTDFITALKDSPLKREQENASDLLRLFMSEVRKNKAVIFGNDKPVNFYVNGYKQVKHVNNNGINHSFRSVLIALLQNKQIKE